MASVRNRFALTLTLALCSGACEVDAPTSVQRHQSRPMSAPPSAPASPTSAVVAPSETAPTAPTAPTATAPKATCTAPSLAHAGPLDGRDEAALGSCVRPSTGPGRAARRCGQEKDVVAPDVSRLARAVPALSPATLKHVRAVAKAGAALGRRANVFGLVGDSMTVSGAFLRVPPRGATGELAASLEDASGNDVIDWFAGAKALRVRGVWTDSFGAPRAAKVGARAPWALAGGQGSPVATMIRQLSPGTAVVLFGGNDAAFTSHLSLDALASRFEDDLGAIIDALEKEGIVVVLNTLARHGSAPGFEDCAAGRELTNWRITVQTNALSARVVDIACRRQLPLIDVRDALDTAVNLGLGPDQIHPSGYEKGPELLSDRGMRCGYNVRNYVTMRMLGQLKELVFDELDPGNHTPGQ